MTEHVTTRSAGPLPVTEVRSSRSIEKRLYEIAARVGFLPLREVAKVRIGLVTGRDSYFLLSSHACETWSIPACCTTPIVDSGRRVAGLYVSKSHVRSWSDTDARCRLFLPCEKHVLNEPRWLRLFLAHGKALGVHKGFKCSHRPIWYDVPVEESPSAFLTYMSHTAPRIVANEARVSATNRLHYVRLDAPMCDARQFAFAFFNDLTLATAEVSGRVYGGGVLKLEPSDCARVMVPNPKDQWLAAISANDIEYVQEKLVHKDRDVALETVSAAVWKLLALSDADRSFLRETYASLVAKRVGPGTSVGIRHRRTGVPEGAGLLKTGGGQPPGLDSSYLGE